MGKSFEEFQKIIDVKNLELVGDGTFDINEEFDVYFDDILLGLSLRGNFLYVYHESCPGRYYSVYKWSGSDEEFKDLTKIIEELSNKENIISLAFHFLK